MKVAMMLTAIALSALSASGAHAATSTVSIPDVIVYHGRADASVTYDGVAIGSLPIEPASAYSAEYLRSVFMPGATAPLHTHSGPEAFYAVSGDTCIETPDGHGSGAVEVLGRQATH